MEGTPTKDSAVSDTTTTTPNKESKDAKDTHVAGAKDVKDTTTTAQPPKDTHAERATTTVDKPENTQAPPAGKAEEKKDDKEKERDASKAEEKKDDNNNKSKEGGASKDKEEHSDSSSDGDDDAAAVQALLEAAIGAMRISSGGDASKPTKPPVLSAPTVEAVAEYIKSGKCKNIIVMTGAGISVAAGIPDFRTPGTGLYDNLQKYNLPYPTAVFEINFFQRTPEPFFLLAKELYPENFTPTATHYFIRLLHNKGLLLRNFTQNIDTLERVAGVPGEVLVEAHGSFGSAHCIQCGKEHAPAWVKEHVFAETLPYCPECKTGLVKPDIVFFGENLPSRFFQLAQSDFPKCDLLLVIGTSLQVQPFASLIRRVEPHTPRLLINMEEVGTSSFFIPGTTGQFVFNHPENTKDVKLLGDCQAGVFKLCDLLGWRADLEALIATGKQNSSL